MWEVKYSTIDEKIDRCYNTRVNFILLPDLR